jgi:hypothetical protein
MSETGFIDKNREKILLFSVVVAFLSSFIPFAYNAYIMWVTLTSAEVMIAWSLCALSIGAASVAFYTVGTRKSLFYPILYLGFHLILSIALCVFEPIWLPLPIVCLIGIIAAKKCTSPDRKFRPHVMNRRTAVCLGICLVSVAVPLLVNFDMPVQTYTLEPLYRDAPRNLEISLTLANLTRASADLFEILEDCNNLEYINISVVAGFLEEFVLNTTLLIGREFKEQGEFIKPYEYYNGDWDAYIADVDAFEKYWNEFTRDVRAAVEALDDEELLTNDSLYLTSGLYYDQILAFANHGIAVDLMPLVEREVYINDYTMERINKTFIVMKRWLSINNLPHRGIVIDTERMWGQDDQTIMDYHKRQLHDQAIAKLGRMIKDLKMFEWVDKGLQAAHGDYTREKWQEFAVKTKKTMVASATFGLHVHDLFDRDDAQQNLYKITILPENVQNNDDMAEFDFVGIMTYETGDNSEHAVYGYCKAGDYFFGERNVPYIFSGIYNLSEYWNRPEVYMENLLRKFQIMRNYGYTTVGMWALTNIHCYTDWKKDWCGGMYDFTRVFGTNGAWDIFEMCQRLQNTWNDSITFTCDSGNFALVTAAVSLLDMYLTGKTRYDTWPIEHELNTRIRPDLFDIKFDAIDTGIRLMLIMAFAGFAMYTYILSKRSVDLPTKHGFYYCFSLFYAFTAMNFMASELELQFKIYPEVIPDGGLPMWLTNPVNSDIYMILFIILSAIPMLYGLEKYILNQKRFILTQMAIGGLIALGVIIFWNDSIPVINAVVLYGWLILGLLLLRTVFVYFTIAVKSTGPIRNLGILMGVGFILLLVGTIGTGTIQPILGIPGEIIGHAIVLISVLLLFRGLTEMK